MQIITVIILIILLHLKTSIASQNFLLIHFHLVVPSLKTGCYEPAIFGTCFREIDHFRYINIQLGSEA